MADVKTIVAKANVEKLTPLQLANGAKELLDEVATGKITGEEDRYSHTDLWDFEANVEGSQAAIAALRPVLQSPRRGAGDRWTPSSPRSSRRAGQAPRRATAGKLYTELSRGRAEGARRRRSTRWPSRSARSPRVVAKK